MKFGNKKWKEILQQEREYAHMCYDVAKRLRDNKKKENKMYNSIYPASN